MVLARLVDENLPRVVFDRAFGAHEEIAFGGVGAPIQVLLLPDFALTVETVSFALRFHSKKLVLILTIALIIGFNRVLFALLIGAGKFGVVLAQLRPHHLNCDHLRVL